VTSPLGPTLEHRVSRATRYIEQQLDTAGTVTWEDTREHLAKTLGIAPALTIDPVLRAVIDLESTGALAHDLQTEEYRRARPTDPQEAPLAEVADAVLALGWPTKADGGQGQHPAQHEGTATRTVRTHRGEDLVRLRSRAEGGPAGRRGQVGALEGLVPHQHPGR
jgi:hypothetical protein